MQLDHTKKQLKNKTQRKLFVQKIHQNGLNFQYFEKHTKYCNRFSQ